MNKRNIPEKEHIASLDVHAQYTFTPECPDELPVEQGTAIVSELNEQAKFASYRIGSKEAHHPKAIWVTADKEKVLSPIKGENVDVHWPAHSVVGTKGFELIQGLPKVSDYDFFIWEGIELDMHPYGVCYHDHAEKLSTGLIEFLQTHHITSVIIGGLATDYCVKVSALQLRRAGFNVIVNLGACRGIANDTIEQALAEMTQAGIVLIQSAKELEK